MEQTQRIVRNDGSYGYSLEYVLAALTRNAFNAVRVATPDNPVALRRAQEAAQLMHSVPTDLLESYPTDVFAKLIQHAQIGPPAAYTWLKEQLDALDWKPEDLEMWTPALVSKH
jgi:hypothetical protein